MEKDQHVDQQYFMHSETARNPWSNYSDPYFVNNADVQDYQEEIVKKEKYMKNKNNNFKKNNNQNSTYDAQQQYRESQDNKANSTSTSERDSYSQNYENYLADTELANNYHYGNNLGNTSDKNSTKNLHTPEYNNKNNNTFDAKDVNNSQNNNKMNNYQSTQNYNQNNMNNNKNMNNENNSQNWQTKNYNSEEYSDAFQKENTQNVKNYNTENTNYGKNINNMNTNESYNANQNSTQQNKYFEAYPDQDAHIDYNTSPGQTGEYNCCGCNNMNNELEDCCPMDVKNSYSDEGRAQNTAYNEKTINNDKNYNYYNTDYAVNDANNSNQNKNNLAIETISACSNNKTENAEQNNTNNKQNNSNNKTENNN